MQATAIWGKIHEIRGTRVILDYNLSEFYQVETKVLNQAVKRNSARFPADFMFQLTQEEHDNLKSQFVTSTWGGNRKLPYAFTEHGVTMLASILRSEKAISMSIFIVRAFIALRHLARQYEELEEKLNRLEATNKKQFKEIYQVLNLLVEKKQQEEDFEKRRRIGFKQ
jgi:hypothetical protein